MIRTEKLACGADLLLEPVDRTDTLCIGFWFRIGSRDEGEGERGYSHFLEHMLFKGTRRRTALRIAQDIDRVGGFLNAFTEKEFTCIFAVLPKEHMELAFDLLGDMSAGSLLDEAELEKEKAVIVNEILSVEDSPEEKGHETYLRLLWGDHPLARRITGEVEEVQAIRRGGLEAFYRARFTAGNAIVAVAGNFDPGRARELAEAALAGCRGAPAPAARSPPGISRFTEFVADRFNQVQIYTGSCYHLHHATGHLLKSDIMHYYTSLVFSTALGESMSSRLFQRLREELGLCYSIYTFRSFFDDVGQLTIYSNATPDRTKPLLTALDAELARLKSVPLSPAEIEDAKSHLKGSMILSREDMESRMKRLVRQFTMIERAYEFEESVRMIDEVGPRQIEDFVSAYLRRELFSTLAFGTEDGSALGGFRFSF